MFLVFQSPKSLKKNKLINSSIFIDFNGFEFFYKTTELENLIRYGYYRLFVINRFLVHAYFVSSFFFYEQKNEVFRMGGYLSYLKPEPLGTVLNTSCGPVLGNLYRHVNFFFKEGV